MRFWAILTILTGLLISLAGCGDGMAHSKRERMHRISKIWEADMKQIVDDWDLIMLNDRPSRFSWWAME